MIFLARNTASSRCRLLPFTILALLFICLSPLPARPALYLDITSARLGRVNIAVPWFTPLEGSDEDVSPDTGKEMARLLSRGLRFHGFIHIIPPARYGGSQTGDWFALNADFTVLGKYRFSEERLTMELRFIDVTTGSMILGRRYHGADDKARTMILRFCDEAIGRLTGERGISRTSIAFVSNRDGYREVYIADVLGDHLRQVTRHRSITVSPRFSPDGKYLSYTSYHRGNPNLYVTDLSQDKITTPVSFRNGLNMAPAWAPDGRSMIVTLSRDGNPDLYRIDRQGKILERLTDHEGINVSPTFSPDGKRIAFVSDRSGSPQIYIMDLATRGVRRLTYLGNYNTTPAWSPKGDWIAYSGRYEGQYQIYIISPEGGRPVRLTSVAGEHESPTWSPDGRQIAFSRRLGDETAIYAVMRNGSYYRRLFDFDGNETFPQWSPRLP